MRRARASRERDRVAWFSCGAGFGKIALAKRRFDLGESPAPVHAVAYDFIERRRQQRLAWRRRAAGRAEQDLHEHDREIVDIAPACLHACFAFGSFANAVASQFDIVTHRVDVPRLDVLVDESVGVQSFKSRSDAETDLGGVGGGEASPLQHFAQVRINALKHHVNGGDVVVLHMELPEAVDAKEVGMTEGLNAAPSRQDLVLVKVAFDNTDENGFAVCVASREERAASFGLQSFVRAKALSMVTPSNSVQRYMGFLLSQLNSFQGRKFGEKKTAVCYKARRVRAPGDSIL